MKNGKLEPKKDSDILMGIYNKFDIYGYQRTRLTTEELVLIFALAKYIQESSRDKKNKKDKVNKQER